MKVAIIGAGITGLYLAWKLSEKGHNVTVFEKKEKIGKGVCSGLFSERILEFVPESKNLIENEIDSVLIYWVGGGWRPKKTIKIRFSKKFFVMSHYELDNLVVRLVEESGAKIFLNHNLATSNIARLGDFERIISCDGAISEVRKSLGLKNPEFRSGIQGFISQKNYLNYVETWPTKNGFIWKIPRKNEIEYGIIEEPKGAKLLFDSFQKKNNLNLEKIRSALIPQGLIVPKNQKITLCGDAAGLTKPWSGGGVIWGLIAADILLKSFPDFLKYQKEIKKFFLPKIIFSKMAKRIVYFLGFKMSWILPKEFKIEGDFLI